ncbi:MAG: hypothetical protein WA672_02310 [Candidatus Angelobacter sp.]
MRLSATHARSSFDPDVLRMVAFSDYRVQDISFLLDFIKKLHSIPNLILYAGDDHAAARRGNDVAQESVWRT